MFLVVKQSNRDYKSLVIVSGWQIEARIFQIFPPGSSLTNCLANLIYLVDVFILFFDTMKMGLKECFIL